MDPQTVREREARCIQEQPAFCTAACPIHVDARGLMDRVRTGDFKGAFALFARFVPFPGVLSRICDHPCEASCKRGEAGDAVRISAIERACADYGSPAPTRRGAASNGRAVAIAGGGLSGLTAAVELAVKGYSVTVFEQAPRLLPRLRECNQSVLTDEIVDADLAVLQNLEVEIRAGSRVESIAALAAEFDAVYVALGASVAPGLKPSEIDPITLATHTPNVFAGGSLRFAGTPDSPIRAVQDGRCAAVSIDRLLQGASLSASREDPGPFSTRLYMNTVGIAPAPAVEPADTSRGYTRDEAVREASRCFPCGCLECVKACEYLAHFRSYPKRYVREIYNNECIVIGNRPSNQMINSCTLCGLCAEVCPEKLSMAEVCLEARQSMVARGKMPPSAHDFALRDLAFSTSDSFTLARHEPGFDSSAAVFFPGCQLSASSPDHVLRTYQHLRQNLTGGVGLILGCCGAPAHWAGQQAQFDRVLDSFTEAWTGLGRPRVITACSSCYRVLADRLPEVPIESLWNVLDRSPLPLPNSSRQRLAIHDPCSTRYDNDVQDSVRRLLAKLGVEIEELNPARQTTCCGYGGLVRFAHPEVADKIVARRIAHSPTDYVTYCAMCRDSFARQGKRALHILDLLFVGDGADPAARPDPGFSRRQENRARLKTRLLRELWSESMPGQESQMLLDISPRVSALLEKRMILLDDVRAVIAHAESTGEKMVNQQSGHTLASCRPACVTFWVEYSAAGNAFVIHNAYSHRMQVG